MLPGGSISCLLAAPTRCRGGFSHATATTPGNRYPGTFPEIYQEHNLPEGKRKWSNGALAYMAIDENLQNSYRLMQM